MFVRIRRLALVLAFQLAVGFTAASAQPAPAAVPAADEALRAVKARFAPDRRLAVFDVKANLQDGVLVVEGDVEGTAARDAALKALTDAGFVRVMDRIAVLPDPALGARRFGVVRVSVANVKSKPSHMSDMVTQTVMGWTVRVLATVAGWHYVHTDPDGYLGWIEDLQLTLVDEAGVQAWSGAPRAIVTVPYAAAFDRPASGATPVTDLVAGALVRMGARQGDWLGIELVDGRIAFVPATHARAFDAWKASVAPAADSIERTALQFMGIPYLWGGTSSKGFDCSGYTRTVFRLNGIELPRDADQQSVTGTAVAIDDQFTQLRKGDLLFFNSGASGGQERVTHVGIYVGNGEFLHASGLVRRNSLVASSPLYSESLRARLIHVRRYLP